MGHRRSGFAKKIEQVHWTVGSWASTSMAAGSTLGFNVLAAQHLPETLLRIRGEFAIALNGAQGSGIMAGVTCGLILVPEGTGTTVTWSPSTDGDAPWIWWDTYNLLYEEQVVDTIAAGLQGVRRVIDSKAMRKVRNTELQFVAENSSISGTPTIRFAGEVRVLAGS